MKNFLKNYLINIIFGTIAFIFLHCVFLDLFDYVNDLLFWVIEGISITLTFCLPKHNSDEKKEYKIFTKFKIILIAIMLIISIFLLVKANNATGWDGLAYGVFWVIDLVLLGTFLMTNFIIRIYYRVKYNQRFKKGSISNLIFIIELFLIIFCILVIMNIG